MKRIITVAVFATFVFTVVTNSFGQKTGGQTGQILRREFARFENVEALANMNGVLIRWQMAEETANAGFVIYRHGPNGLERVGDSLIPGSFARSTTDTIYGETYEIFDSRGATGTNYVVQAWKMGSNKKVSSKTVTAMFTPDLEAGEKKANSSLLKDTVDLSKELSEAHETSLLPPDLPTHRWVVAQPGAKIGVRKDGMYRVTRAELQAAGFNVSSNSANWRLFMEGNEQAIIVGAGDQYIDFYGRGIDTVESDTRVYYLVADAVPGRRMQTKVLRNIGGTAFSNNYRVSIEKKERVNYIYDILNGDAENYWGRIIFSLPTTVPITLTGIDFTAPTATFTIKIQGFSATAHATRVILNGHELALVSGQQLDSMSLTYTIPTSFLIEGNNSIELATTTDADVTLFDTATFGYARKYQADQNKVPFSTIGLRKVDLGNFSSANVRLFDITYDGNPILVTNVPVVQNGATFTMRLPSARASFYYGVEDSALMQSPTVTTNNPSTLSTSTNAANLVIISYGSADFMAAAETWANYRRNQGFTVKVIDVADIFDEFDYGVLSARSINRFLNYAKNNWQTQPNYVLLLGDADADSRNYEGGGYWNMVPPKMVDTVYTEVPSDEALADFDGDGLAELAIGRIPARTVQAITTVYNKTTAFETTAMQPLNRGAVFAYDLPSTYDFQGLCQTLRNELPNNIPATMVGRGDPNAQATLVNEINLNNGRFIVNYCGHGTASIWASSSFFGTSIVPSLTNSNPTIFTMLTCLNGYFINYPNDSLAEALLKSQTGGAAAAWASTGKTTPDVQLPMGQRFYNQLNAGNITRMGDLVRDAKQVIPYGADVRLSWALLGDPMMKVRP